MNFVNLFLKCGNYNKSRFYEQILKVATLLLENSFSFSYAEFMFNYGPQIGLELGKL
ncbi:hypothetical protein LEP1GSC188_4013 [Leptospira weilii serovar Topaz str. LT2116]|uniref:Uncharacterized protein n=1 Tax=Leptospira weilii serovar Topaz str. LT2116 TaxID=1088540 RepID=M3H5W1_9LEPT|nr:hypothetical protein LEP1GSC188_4013 [Leptospira weilii serovar Topaz str. LT2116]